MQYCKYFYFRNHTFKLPISCLGRRFREFIPSSAPNLPIVDGLMLLLIIILLLGELSEAEILSSDGTKAIVWAKVVLSENFQFWLIETFSDVLVTKTDFNAGWVSPGNFKSILFQTIAQEWWSLHNFHLFCFELRVAFQYCWTAEFFWIGWRFDCFTFSFSFINYWHNRFCFLLL